MVVSFDLSSSRNSKAREEYTAIVKTRIIEHLGTTDAITIIPIDRASQTASTTLFDLDCALHRYGNELAGTDEERIIATAHQDSLKRAAERFDHTLTSAITTRASYANGSDILGSLAVAAKYKREGYTNIMIVLSDMLQCGGSLNFAVGLKTDTDVNAYLKQIPLLNLTGWQVIIITGGQASISPDRFATVEHFWRQYFTACHATVLEYSSGSTQYLQHFLSTP